MKDADLSATNKHPVAWWIFAASAGMWGLFGLVLAFFHNASWLSPLMNLLWGPFIGNGTLPNELSRLLDFVLGILGAVMLSWSVALSCLGWQALHNGRTGAWWASLATILAWFIIDESFSILFGVWVNALGNLVLLAGFLVPLALARLHHRGLNNG